MTEIPGPGVPDGSDVSESTVTPGTGARAAAPGVERVLAQLAEDTKLYAAELVEVLVHAQAVRSSADFRILQAASLILEDRQAEYMARVAHDPGSGEMATAEERAAAIRASVESSHDAAAAGVNGAARVEDPRSRFGPDGLETAVCEVGAALTVPPARARQLIEAGSVMRYHLPKVGEMLAIGRIDLTRFLAIVQRTTLIEDADMAAVDQALAGEIGAREPMSMTRFTTMVDATIATVDADALRRRRQLVEADRHVTIRPDRRTPGQASVSGTLPSAQAAGVDARLAAMADEVHSDDPRTRKQRRADALIALARGEQHLACGCDACTATTDGGVADRAAAHDPTDHAAANRGAADDPAASDPSASDHAADVNTGIETGSAATMTEIAAPAGSVPTEPPLPAPSCDHAPHPTFHIVVNLSTLLGADSHPAFLDGHGLIDADTARRLLAEATRSYVHPDHGDSVRRARAEVAAEHRYAISAKLRGLVAAGELCCSFPGCSNPVFDADLDHTDPFDHSNPTAGGKTSRRNLKPLCRFHHRHKTFAVGWRDYHTPLGSVYFQSPSRHIFAGNAYTGRDLFTALAGRDKPPDHPGRQRMDDIRRRRADATRRADTRAENRWNAANPAPF
ncbi:hypothetical protein GCM10009624_20940 [Gordonia sinesedis]